MKKTGIKGIKEDARIMKIQITGANKRLARLLRELKKVDQELAAMESTK